MEIMDFPLEKPKKIAGSLQGSSLVQMDQFVSIARGHQRCAIGLRPGESPALDAQCLGAATGMILEAMKL